MAERVIGFEIKVEGTDKQAKELSRIEVELAGVTKERKKLLDVQKEGKKLNAEEERQLDELTREQSKLRKEKADTNKIIKKQNQAVDTLARSYDGLVLENSKLRQAMNRLPLDDTTGELKRLQAQHAKNTAELKDFDAEVGQNFRNVGNYSSALDGLGGILGKLVPGFEGVASKLGGVSEGAIEGGLSFKNFGATAVKALGPAAVAGAVIGVGAALVSLQQELEKTRKSVQQLTDATGENLDILTSKIQATSDTFGQDFNEVLLAANSLSKQMGISAGEALDLINKGFALGADANGEFLETLREYPNQFKEVGLTGAESIALISQNVKSGIFSDKGIDTIKEAGLSLRELTKPTREALDGIGLSSDAIAKSLEDGTQSVFEVIQTVSKQLGTLPPQSAAVGTALADIFKGAGEDAGLQYIKTLGDINLNLDDVIANADEFTKTQLELVAAEERIEKVFNDVLGAGDNQINVLNARFKTLVAEGLEGMVNGLVAIANGFITIRNESATFRVALNLITTAAQENFKIIGNAFRILVIEPFKAGGELLQAVFTGNFAAIEGIVKSSFTSIKDIAVNTATGTADAFVNAWKTGVTPDELIDPIDLTKGFTLAGSKGGDAFGKGFIDGLPKSDGVVSLIKASQIISEKEIEKANKIISDLANEFTKRVDRTDLDDIDLSEQFFPEEDIAALQATEDDFLNRSIEAARAAQERKDQIRDSAIQVTQGLAADTTAFIAVQNDIRAKNEIETNKKLLEENKITEEEFQKQRSIILRRQAESEKQLALFNIVINTAAAILKAAPNVPLQVATGILGASQLALVASQPVPQFERGGAVLSGASHASGGIPIEAEGGEIVLTKGVYQNPQLRSIASDLNVAGGGRKFAAGGVVTSANVSPSVASLSSPQRSTQELASAIAGAVNDKRVVVVESDITDTQTTVEVNESLGTF